MWTTENLQSESDVEQKFVYPFLTESAPLGLGIPPAAIRTKHNVRRLTIGKGASEKSYFPDYLIVTLGMPLVVLEAKKPGESLDDAYREARLYATELNALLPHKLNPVRFVMATDGVSLSYGHADQAVPEGVVAVAALEIYSPHLARIGELMGWGKLEALAAECASKLRPMELVKARRLLGGLAKQNEEIGQNSFGATLTTELSPIFNPTSTAERADVARNAYVPSKRRERYIDPIDNVIRAARPASETFATEITDTGSPREVIGKLANTKDLEHKIILLIGSVGSGKSTFVDYLTEVALPKDVVASTVWCRLNMNAAPVNRDEIYPWLRRDIMSACRAAVPDADFDDLDTLMKLYGVEVAKFRKGTGRLYESNKELFQQKLAEEIDRCRRDQIVDANAHVRFVCAQRGKLLVIVLDNCDKKTRDEQLLMFEAAQWLQKEFRCLVMLPLRDETYDNHRHQPPLDTALKDLVFRIEPPMFQHVLMARVKLALKRISGSGSEKLHFLLPNGMQVEYPRSEQAYYLTSIVKSLFEHDRFARRMIVGISGRNMRRALEMFLEFCNSGHIGEDQIFKIRISEGAHVLPFHQVATVLIRMNRRFYDSDYSYIKNVFAAYSDDVMPSYFVRHMILRWLRDRFQSAGTNGLRGYFPKLDLKRELLAYGPDPDMVDRECNYLLSSQCIIAEHLRTDVVADEDLIRLGPAGFAHLDLLRNANYLAALAEDTLFSDRSAAMRVADRIRTQDSQLHVTTIADNAAEVVEFLSKERAKLLSEFGQYLVESDLERLTDLSDPQSAVGQLKNMLADDPWFGSERRFARESAHVGVITNIRDFGYFVELKEGLTGLVHISKTNGISPSIGDSVRVQVQHVDPIQRRMALTFIELVAEEIGDAGFGDHTSH